MESENNFAYNLLHIILIIFIIIVIYLHVKNINLLIIFDNDNLIVSKSIPKSTNNIKNKVINILTSTNQQVLSYTDKDLNQKFKMEDNQQIKIGNSLINIVFKKNIDYTKENYLSTEIYKLGDVVTVSDNGKLRDFINLVIDPVGCINQNPLKDNNAWLEIFIL